jgi:hypothetical protein
LSHLTLIVLKEISHAYKKLTSEDDSSDNEEYSYSAADIITELFGQFFSGIVYPVNERLG